jgi:hypothetical protein
LLVHVAGEVSERLRAQKDVVPRRRLGAGEVARAEAFGEGEREEALREVTHVRRGPDTVDQPAGWVAPAQAAERARQVVAPAAEHETGADDDVAVRRGADVLLAEDLQHAVAVDRAGQVTLIVRRPLLAVEHVVRRDVHEDRAGRRRRLGELPRPERVPGHGGIDVRLVLARVHLRERGGVEDHRRTDLIDHGVDGLAVSDVELGVGDGTDVVVGTAEHLDDRSPEAAPGPGDEDLHDACARSSTSPTQSRLSRYHLSVIASPSENRVAGRHPSASRRSHAIP